MSLVQLLALHRLDCYENELVQISFGEVLVFVFISGCAIALTHDFFYGLDSVTERLWELFFSWRDRELVRSAAAVACVGHKNMAIIAPRELAKVARPLWNNGR